MALFNMGAHGTSRRDIVEQPSLEPLHTGAIGTTCGAVYTAFLSAEELEKHRNVLTVVPQGAQGLPGAQPEAIQFLHSHGNGNYSLPRFYGLGVFGQPSHICVNSGANMNQRCNFTGKLSGRNRQAEVVAAITKSWSDSDPRRHGVRITLPCGFGKTVVALAAASSLGKRTLVVAPNNVLVKQWEERCNQFIPSANVITLRGNPQNIRDCEWLVPNTASDIVSQALTTRTRTITFSAADVERKRKTTLRCKRILQASVSDPYVATVLVNNERTLRLCPNNGGELRVTVQEEVALGDVSITDIDDVGALVTYRKARTGHELAQAVGKPIVPGVLTAHSRGSQADVVVTTVQTLAMTYIPDCAFSTIGLLIADEVHSMCARTFSKALQRVPAKCMLSLSATPKRKDGLHVALPWLTGVEVARLHRAWERVDVVKHVYTGSKVQEIHLPNGTLILSRMITQLARDAERTRRIAAVIDLLYTQGRTIIVLSERVEHLQELRKSLDSRNFAHAGILCGDTPAHERSVAANAKILLATYPMCRQGFDKAELDTLVMATPVTAIEQCVGRILRVHPSKQTPLVVDVVDPYSIFQGESRKRDRQYHDWGYHITQDALE